KKERKLLAFPPKTKCQIIFLLPRGNPHCSFSLAPARSVGHVVRAKETVAARWRHPCRFV
ncbi:hypothetical protein M5D96_006387, partial [Drosophila gunungcola]